MRSVIELVGQAIEALAVVIIVIAIVHGTVRYLFHVNAGLLVIVMARSEAIEEPKLLDELFNWVWSNLVGRFKARTTRKR